MKTNSRRNRRHRNPETTENKETPFFSPREKAVQKKDDSFFQPKLSFGQQGDSYEREADAVADKVVSKQPTAGKGVQRKEISSVQMKDTPDKKEEDKKKVQKKDSPDKKEEDKKVQKKEEDEPLQLKAAPDKKEEKKVQKKEEPEKKPAADEQIKEDKDEAAKKSVMAKEKPSGLQQGSEDLGARLKEQSGRGNTLSPEVRNEMSNAIGADFSNVNIHTGDKAAELSNEICAQAFTHGNDVYFNSGKYDTESTAGKHLLAHELTHVVQQGAAPQMNGGSKKGGSTPAVQRETSTPVPADAVVDDASKVARFPIGDFSVEVKPDRKAVKGEAVDPNGAKTSGDIAYKLEYKKNNKNQVTSVTIKKTLIIETVYSDNATAQGSSAYGRGSLKQDKKDGHGTLGFHEGSHGTDLMNYVRTTPFPEIVISKPVSMKKFEALKAAWMTEYTNYVAAMIQDSVEKTDNAKDPVETKKPEEPKAPAEAGKQ